MVTDPTLKSSIQKGKLSSAMSFDQKVWAVTSRIPKGKVATYAWVARQLRSKGYRAVGGALNRNPFAPKVPCHRVVGSMKEIILSDDSETAFKNLARKI